MTQWFCFVAYILFAYGMSVIITQGVGPANIFIRLRIWAEEISPNFGLLFRCMLCMPTNIGIVFSLVNWFLIPFSITPFNFILGGSGLWWLTAIMDGCLTGGICHFMWNLDDYIDKSTPVFEDEMDDRELIEGD